MKAPKSHYAPTGWPAPWGRHTRYMLRAYLQNTFMTLSAAIVIATSIDLAFFLPKTLAANPDAGEIGAIVLLARYLSYRGVDFATELLPLTSFLGILWSEIAHTTSRERTIVWLSGRRPWQCLMPVVVFGAIVGNTQAALDYYLRPAAVTAQVSAGLGAYGERFRRSPDASPRWIAAGDNLIAARIDFGPPVNLLDVQFYRLDARHQLQEIVFAEKAVPQVSGTTWNLSHGRRIPTNSVDSGATYQASDAIHPSGSEPFQETLQDLSVDPVWLANFGVNVRYLERSSFDALGAASFSPRYEYETWRQARNALSLFAAIMPLFASCLSLALIPYEARLALVLVIASLGYGAHTLMKLSIVAGEHGRIAPLVSAWAVPLGLLALSLVVVLAAQSSWFRRRTIRPS